MKRFLTFSLLLLATNLSAAQGQSPQVAVAAAPPLMLTIVLLVLACACVLFCFQVYSLVRGGQFSRIWLIFLSGFGILAVSQLLLLLTGFGVLTPNGYLMPVLLAFMSGTFIYGLFETKKVLG